MGSVDRGGVPSRENSGISGPPGVFILKSGEGGNCVIDAALESLGDAVSEGTSLIVWKIVQKCGSLRGLIGFHFHDGPKDAKRSYWMEISVPTGECRGLCRWINVIVKHKRWTVKTKDSCTCGSVRRCEVSFGSRWSIPTDRV